MDTKKIRPVESGNDAKREKGREIIIGEDKLKSLVGGMNVNIVINEANNPEATAEAVMARMQLAVATEGRTWK